jgi:glutamine synthetase
MASCFEYIWIDSNLELRSKTRIYKGVNQYPDDWTCDGSSCGLAVTECSDIILRPVFECPDPFRKKLKAENNKTLLVLCECYLADGKTPHPLNFRSKCKEAFIRSRDTVPWVGFEQEYILFHSENNAPYEWSKVPSAKPGSFYCGVGAKNAIARHVMEEIIQKCLYANLHIGGTNFEVCLSQQEYQIGPLDPLRASDELWVSRYILSRICEKYKITANLHPKPMLTESGSGCHCNFSTKDMRGASADSKIALSKAKEACEKLAERHKEHLEVYGQHNELRLTGIHETSNYDKFTFGERNRNCSVRIPLLGTMKQMYIEDRRPAANCDPYRVTEALMSTLLLGDAAKNTAKQENLNIMQ